MHLLFCSTLLESKQKETFLSVSRQVIINFTLFFMNHDAVLGCQKKKMSMASVGQIKLPGMYTL